MRTAQDDDYYGYIVDAIYSLNAQSIIVTVDQHFNGVSPYKGG